MAEVLTKEILVEWIEECTFDIYEYSKTKQWEKISKFKQRIGRSIGNNVNLEMITALGNKVLVKTKHSTTCYLWLDDEGIERMDYL